LLLLLLRRCSLLQCCTRHFDSQQSLLDSRQATTFYISTRWSYTTSLSTLSTFYSYWQQFPVIVTAELFTISSCSPSPWKTNPNAKADMPKQVIIIIERVHVSRTSFINTHFCFCFFSQSRWHAHRAAQERQLGRR